MRFKVICPFMFLWIFDFESEIKDALKLDLEETEPDVCEKLRLDKRSPSPFCL